MWCWKQPNCAKYSSRNDRPHKDPKDISKQIETQRLGGRKGDDDDGPNSDNTFWNFIFVFSNTLPVGTTNQTGYCFGKVILLADGGLMYARRSALQYLKTFFLFPYLFLWKDLSKMSKVALYWPLDFGCNDWQNMHMKFSILRQKTFHTVGNFSVGRILLSFEYWDFAKRDNAAWG